jgi:hypothetical protein
LKALGIAYDNYLNLDYDLGIKKLGPFSTMEYSEEHVEKATSAILRRIMEM